MSTACQGDFRPNLRVLLHSGILRSLPLALQSEDKRVLIAAAEVVRKGLAKITLLGNPETIQAEAAKLGVDISGCQIVDHLVSGLHCTVQAHAVDLSGETISDQWHRFCADLSKFMLRLCTLLSLRTNLIWVLWTSDRGANGHCLHLHLVPGDALWPVASVSSARQP